MMRTILVVICGVQVYGDFVCNPPQESRAGPLPPVLPESYHMVYELNNVHDDTSSFCDVWLVSKLLLAECVQFSRVIDFCLRPVDLAYKKIDYPSTKI